MSEIDVDKQKENELKLVEKQLSDAMVNKNSSFHGNPLLKAEREQVAFTKEHLLELKKCAEDPIYFAEKYMKIVNIDTGLQTIKLYPYQKRLLTGLNEHRYNIILSCRQSGKCVTKDTLIEVRNKKYNEGKPFKISIGDFYNWMDFREKYKNIL